MNIDKLLNQIKNTNEEDFSFNIERGTLKFNPEQAKKVRAEKIRISKVTNIPVLFRVFTIVKENRKKVLGNKKLLTKKLKYVLI
jgi:hypothetical protein